MLLEEPDPGAVVEREPVVPAGHAHCHFALPMMTAE